MYYLYGFMFIQNGSSKTYKRDAVNLGGALTTTATSMSGAAIEGKGGWQETNSGSKDIQNLVVGVLYKKLEPITLPDTEDQIKKTELKAVVAPEQAHETKVTYGSPETP